MSQGKFHGYSFLIVNMYLSGVWLGVDVRTNTKKDLCLKHVNSSNFNSQYKSGEGDIL